MSSKTTFKRIALVAVAALSLGVLSVAPSQAANAVLTFGTGDAAGADTASVSIVAERGETDKPPKVPSTWLVYQN